MFLTGCVIVCACVCALGSLPLGLNRSVLLQFHAAMNRSYGERCSLLRCNIVRVAVHASRHAVGRARAGVVPVSHRGCPGLISGQAVWDFDVEYIYGFVGWGGLHAKSMTSQRYRATYKIADMRYYGNVMTTTRWRLYVILHLQQYSRRLNFIIIFFLWTKWQCLS